MDTTQHQAATRAPPPADADVRAGQIRLVYEHAPGTYFATLGATLVAAFLLWRVLPHVQVLSWVAFGVVLTAARLYLLARLRRVAPVEAAPERWGHFFTAASAAGALFWCSAPFLLFVPGVVQYTAFVVILIGGMIAGAGYALSPYRPAFRVFVWPVGIALVLKLLSVSGFTGDYEATMLALAGLVALFVPIVYTFGRQSEASLVKLLRSEWRNRQLTEALNGKLAELEQSHRSLEEENRARVQSEAVLRQNEEQLKLFELAIASTSSGVVFTDPLQRDNPIVYVNPAFSHITGYSAEEALGQNLRFLNVGDHPSEDIARLRAAIREEQPCSLVLRSRRKGGAEFWNDVRIMPLRNGEGRVVRFVVILDDVTARVDMEGALRKTRDELQAILDNAPALIFTKDLENRYLMVNRRWEQVFGTPAAQVVGRSTDEIMPRAYADVMRANDLKVIESGNAQQSEMQLPREGGSRFHLTSKFPLRDAAGRIYAICGISTDITERKREQVMQGMHHRVSRAISESSTVQDAMRRVLHILCESTPWDWGGIHLVDKESGALKPGESWSEPKLQGSEFEKLAMFVYGEGRGAALLPRARLAREPVWISDVSRIGDPALAQAAAAAGLHTAVGIPIFVDAGVVGMLEFYGCEKQEPDRAFLRMARSIGQELGQFARRCEAESEMRRAEERLALALEGSELALWDWRIATGELYLSPRWAQMLGRTAAETHTTVRDLVPVVHPDDLAGMRRAIVRAFRGRESLYSFVHRVRRADGGWIWIQSTGKVVERDDRGRPVRMAGTNADVTARLAAEEDLRRTRIQLQAILDNSPAMIYAKDLRGEIMVTNRPGARDGGYDGSAHPAAQGLQPAEREVMEARRALQTEELVIEADGAHTYICTRFPLRHGEGKPYGVCGIATDITDRKRMEAALGESEDRFRQFAESVNVGFWIIDTGRAGLAYGNPALQRIFFDMSDAELARFEDSKLALVDAEDREGVEEAYGTWLRSASTTRLDIDYRISRGAEVRWLHDHAVKLDDGNGRPYRILGITEDVTGRKAGEDELRQTRTFLESVIEHLPIMIFVKDAVEFRYVRLNRAGEELLGSARQQILGKRDADLFSAEVADSYQVKDREALAAGSVIDIAEEPVATRRGLRFLHTKKIPIADATGTPRYVLGISEDVTERKQSSEAIQEMNAALAKKAADLAASNEELEAFAYSVSHDLRAPLRHVNGFINLLRDHIGERLDATSLRYLGKIQSASSRMSGLIDELLALSRMSRMEMRYTRVALDRLVKEVVQEISAQLQGREVEWIVGDLPAVRGDRILLRQALFNLLDNAIKYTAANPQARIEVGCENEGGDEVTVYVRDNGVGFDMKYAHKLFGVFQRLHRQEEFPGTGIGLAHVRRIVERHGGRVWAQAAKGEGAVFYVALPKGPGESG